MKPNLHLTAAMLLFLSWTVLAQSHAVAITVDDLPYASGGVAVPKASAESTNRKLLAGFQMHHFPVTGFVIQKTVESFGLASGTKILKQWTDRGFDLGNHTYSHPDFNEITPGQMEQEIVRGESTIAPLMKQAAKEVAFFRFPFNHTGDTKDKHDRIAAFLAQRGYRLATCTIDTSDYLFNDAYVRILAKSDADGARKLREEYLAYSRTEIGYYAGLNKQVLGYEPPQAMLLHDNRLNADVIDPLLRIFEELQYRFVSLDTAQSDPAYQTPGVDITKFGPMWGYRWARERNVKVNGSLEPEPPKWILEYGNERAKSTP
jgi:peptidoglycan/xylan/chitin deacetylase (PgdA/CDA1 family)